MKSLEYIAAALEGYDPQALPAHTVNAFLAQLVPTPTRTETIPLLQALGRVLADDVICPINVPDHDNSAMDGYAFDGSRLRSDAPLSLQVVGTARTGAAYGGPFAKPGPGAWCAHRYSVQEQRPLHHGGTGDLDCWRHHGGHFPD